ncbi:hypothetical protein ACUN0C_19905 [Faunimonas sp. B44]|uniref:hypothetical protein n=1 Tax=Faunimonas sp. B44 TaxID=3461493 RepID=UPI004043CD86
MPTLYLHAGLPKTATSSLQVFLARNASRLFKAGVRYPWSDHRVADEGLITSGNGARIARFSFSDLDMGKGRKALQQLKLVLSKPEGRSVLISSEFFSAWPEAAFADLAKISLDYGFEIKVIIYLKDQADVLVGHYFQALKRRPGFADTNGSDFRAFADKYIDHPYLNFESLLAMLERVLGRSGVIVRSSARGMLRNANVFRDFLDALQLEDSRVKFDFDIPLVNPTPKQDEMYLRALMNAFAPTVKFSDMYLSTVNRLYESGIVSGVRDRNYFVDSDVIEDWRARFRPSNERVCQEWFGRSVDEVLPGKIYREREQFDFHSADLTSVVAVLGGLLVATSGRVEQLEKPLRVRTQSAPERDGGELDG